MNVLITGSSGQIGTNLGLQLQREGHTVLGLDIRSNSWAASLETVLADLRQPLTPGVLPEEKFDCIVHLAAWPMVHKSVLAPSLAIDNILMLFNVSEIGRRLKCPIVFSSSREVYGNIPATRFAEHLADIANAASPYAASKLSCESLLHSYSRCYGLPHVIVRLSNVYGRFDNDLLRLERAIPRFVQSIANGCPVQVYGQSKVLDFTYVDDCVRGIARAVALLADGRLENETINIASGRGVALGDLVKVIGRECGREPVVEVLPTRPGEVVRYVADLRRAESLLGYVPEVFIEEGIARYIKWCREADWFGAPVSGV